MFFVFIERSFSTLVYMHYTLRPISKYARNGNIITYKNWQYSSKPPLNGYKDKKSNWINITDLLEEFV